MHGGRMADGKLVPSEEVKAVAKWLLMHDTRPRHITNLLDNALASDFMDLLSDKDQKDATDYLKNTPTTKEDLAVAIIFGIAGGGKSSYLAHYVLARFIANPEGRFLVVAASNSAADVLITKIQKAVDCFSTHEIYGPLIKDFIPTCLYSDPAEDS